MTDLRPDCASDSATPTRRDYRYEDGFRAGVDAVVEAIKTQIDANAAEQHALHEKVMALLGESHTVEYGALQAQIAAIGHRTAALFMLWHLTARIEPKEYS